MKVEIIICTTKQGSFYCVNCIKVFTAPRVVTLELEIIDLIFYSKTQNFHTKNGNTDNNWNTKMMI